MTKSETYIQLMIAALGNPVIGGISDHASNEWAMRWNTADAAANIAKYALDALCESGIVQFDPEPAVEIPLYEAPAAATPASTPEEYDPFKAE